MVPKTKEYAKKLSAVMSTYLNLACYLKYVTKSYNVHTKNVGMIKDFCLTNTEKNWCTLVILVGQVILLGFSEVSLKTLSGALHPNILPKPGKRNALHKSLNHCSGFISIIE